MAGLVRQAFSLVEVGEILGCSRQSVKRMVDGGRLVGLDIGERGVRVPRWSLERFLGGPVPDAPAVPVVSGRLEVVGGGEFS